MKEWDYVLVSTKEAVMNAETVLRGVIFPPSCEHLEKDYVDTLRCLDKMRKGIFAAMPELEAEE